MSLIQKSPMSNAYLFTSFKCNNICIIIYYDITVSANSCKKNAIVALKNKIKVNLVILAANKDSKIECFLVVDFFSDFCKKNL